MVCSLGIVLAQKPDAKKMPRFNKEEIVEARLEYLTKKLELTPTEAEQLNKVLVELDTQRFALWKEVAPLHKRAVQRDETLTEAELSTLLDLQLANKVKEVELERTYYLRCKAFLPLTKLIRLDRANRQFVSDYFRRHHNQPDKK